MPSYLRVPVVQHIFGHWHTMICTFEAAMGLHLLWLYLFQKIGARNIGEIETVSHAIQFVQLDQH